MKGATNKEVKNELGFQLTGKCKEDFEKWLISTNQAKYTLGELTYNLDSFLCRWIKIPQSMQYGVYVDFFDSVGIRAYIDEVGQLCNIVKFSLLDGDVMNGTQEFETRQEARTEAIKKANEIYNLNIK